MSEPSAAWPDSAGHFLHNLLNPASQPGLPYTHTIVPPEPLYWDDFGTPVYPEPGPAVTIAADSPYRAEVMQDTGNTGCYWPIEDAPA